MANEHLIGMGCAGFALSTMLLAKLRERGVIDDADVRAIIADAQRYLGRLGETSPGQHVTAAQDLLWRLAERADPRTA